MNNEEFLSGLRPDLVKKNDRAPQSTVVFYFIDLLTFKNTPTFKEKQYKYFPYHCAKSKP